MSRILWACMVHEADANWLAKYLLAVNEQSVQPDELLLVCSGRSELISEIVQNTGVAVKQIALEENLGFNPGFNSAVSRAIDRGFDWLATMTVRAIPEINWLKNAVISGAKQSVGMITTLHVDAAQSVASLGHNLGTAGELFDFAESFPVERLADVLVALDPKQHVWSPCSGGALYRVKALVGALDAINQPEILRPRGFKSYNCDAIAFAIREAGYENAIALEARCTRTRTGSTSKVPDRPGLLMNQEINRLANLFEYWPEQERQRAVELYLQKTRTKADLTEIDLRIARTLGEGLARKLPAYPAKLALLTHISGSAHAAKTRKVLLAECEL
jgi:hypothetical protein